MFAGTDGVLLATRVFSGLVASETVTERANAGAYHSPGYTNKMCDCFCVTETKIKYLAAFQAPKQRNLLFVPATKHPHCVYLRLTGSMVSRGRNSLQLFVLTKAFIAKVQKLTSVDCQEGDKRKS